MSYSMWPISWCAVKKSSMVTLVHIMILRTGAKRLWLEGGWPSQLPPGPCLPQPRGKASSRARECPSPLAKPRQAHPNMGCSSSCKSKAWRGTRQNAFSSLKTVPGVRENWRFVRSSCSPKLGDKLAVCVGVGTRHQS